MRAKMRSETQRKHASHARCETQDLTASHHDHETHINFASHNDHETHEVNAGHRVLWSTKPHLLQKTGVKRRKP